jgi:peptidoglycan/LPS O-acetylase OafA/YrhL
LAESSKAAEGAEQPFGALRTQGSSVPRELGRDRLLLLDGVRALSILFVLAAHMLPLGPKHWQLNKSAGMLGMALFFTLSGFLITTQLHARRHVRAFFVRRLFRIVPLAWLYSVLIVVFLFHAGWPALRSHLLYLTNYDFAAITPLTTHFWSLCVEVHFYIFVGLLMASTQFRGFRAIPLIWIAAVLFRAWKAPEGTIETHYRVDEILSGAVLGLIYVGELGPRFRKLVTALPLWLLVAGLAAACLPAAGRFDALRGTLAAAAVGNALFRSDRRAVRWLEHRTLGYIAAVSYAVYVVHPLTMWGWLGDGNKVFRYLVKRPLSVALTFALAHLSTRYFERPLLGLGKRIAQRMETRDQSAASFGLAVVPAGSNSDPPG